MAMIDWEGNSIDDTKVTVIEEVVSLSKTPVGKDLVPPFVYRITVDSTLLTSKDYPTEVDCKSSRNTFISNLP